MKLDLICTSRGLIPVGDDSYDEKKKLKNGTIYRADIKVPRNYKFLKKAFSLLNAAWELMDEGQQAKWRSKDGFRAYLTVAAGFYEVYFSPIRKEWVEIPRSWSFDHMGEDEFNELYERMKDVIFVVLGDKITEEIFQTVLSNF